jgi:hypothetical protein
MLFHLAQQQLLNISGSEIYNTVYYGRVKMRKLQLKCVLCRISTLPKLDKHGANKTEIKVKQHFTSATITTYLVL